MPDIRSILVPLDGSGFAENALPVAVNLARGINASVHLVRVHTQLPLWDVGAEIVVLSQDMEQQVLQREEAYLDQLAGRIRAEGCEAAVAVVKGEIVPALREYAEVYGNQLIVMTSHGWGGIRRAVLGSVADSLMRTVNIPLLIVTPGMTGRIDPQWPRRVLVPLDGSELAESALDQVRTFGLATDARLLLTTVVQSMMPSIMPWAAPSELFLESVDQRELSARSYLADVSRDLATEGLSADSRIAVGPKVPREILRVAESERCDLIAIATHGAGGLDRVMFGSVTDQVVRHSHVPILVVRPAATPAAEPVLAGASLEGVPL